MKQCELNHNNTITINVQTPLLMKPNPKSLTSALHEAKSMLSISFPMALTSLLLYSRSLISMLFLGRLGHTPLAAGSLAIALSNITGYSLISGLSMAMDPICGQAVGARRSSLLSLTFQRTVLLLLASSLPIAALWSSMHRILTISGQDPDVVTAAHSYILCSIPDLALQSFLHPIRIFLRAQSITLPLTHCAAVSTALHLPINCLLVSVLGLGIRGVALANFSSNFILLLLLFAYVYFSGVHEATGGALRFTRESFTNWRPLLELAIPSCVSVCLEWWWYEIMILLCSLLLDPKSTVASMGILLQTTSFIYIFPSSLGFGVSTRVSNELGANRPDNARRSAVIGVALGEVLGVLALLFTVSVRNVWPRMFTKDDRIVALTAAALPILGMCELGNCPQTTGCGVLRGSARPRVGANVNLGAFYGVGMPAAMAMAFWLGMDFKGLWMGLLAAQGTCVVVMLAVIRRTDWAAQAQRAQRLTGGIDGAVEVKVEDSKCGVSC